MAASVSPKLLFLRHSSTHQTTSTHTAFNISSLYHHISITYIKTNSHQQKAAANSSSSLCNYPASPQFNVCNPNIVKLDSQDTEKLYHYFSFNHKKPDTKSISIQLQEKNTFKKRYCSSSISSLDSHINSTLEKTDPKITMN